MKQADVIAITAPELMYVIWNPDREEFEHYYGDGLNNNSPVMTAAQVKETLKYFSPEDWGLYREEEADVRRFNEALSNLRVFNLIEVGYFDVTASSIGVKKE